MKIYEYTYNRDASPIQEKCVLALGFFDGVHIAHRDLILCARDIAKENGFSLGIFTFHAEGEIKSGVPRLYGTRQKLDIFEKMGADFTVVADFPSLSQLSPTDFVDKVLIRDLNCEICVAGFNFRFGKNASGNADMLEQLTALRGKSSVIRDEMTSGGVTVSASLIRELISSGDMKSAAILLGTPYFLHGQVSHGNSVGRKLGYPTVNLQLNEHNVIPKLGVYRCAVPIGKKIYTGITNIGKCPTFGEREIHAETYILDFAGDLYEQDIDIYLLDFLREEMRFSNSEELKKQINIDIKRILKENGDLTWQELGLN